MTVREAVLQACREWLKAGAVAPTATPLTDAQVIPADDKGPRPPLPYLTVKVTTPGTVVGAVDEQLRAVDGGSGDPTVAVRGARRATVSVNAFGDLAAEWVSEATLALQRPSILAALTVAGITVDAFGGPVDLATVLDTEIEARVLREFEVLYSLTSDPEDVIEGLSVVLDYNAEGTPDTLSQPMTIPTP